MKSTLHASDEPIANIEKATPASRWKWLLRLGLGLLVLGFIVSRSNAGQIWGHLQAVPWPVMVGAVLFYLAGQFLSAWKWQLLLNSVLRERGDSIALWECCRLYLVGMFWNLWMPSSIGGDAVRIYLAPPQCGRMLSATSIFVERLTGMIALVGVAAFGMVLNTLNREQSARATHLLLTMLAAIVVLVLGFTLLRALAFRLEKRDAQHALVQKWIRLHRALDLYMQREQWKVLLAAMGLSFVFQASQVVLNIVLARAVGLHLPAATFWWLAPLLALSTLLPVGIGGLGVREAAAVAFLSGSPAASQTIVAWSLLWQATVWLSSLPGALLGGKSRQR